MEEWRGGLARGVVLSYAFSSVTLYQPFSVVKIDEHRLCSLLLENTDYGYCRCLVPGNG